MRQEIEIRNSVDENGNPAGGSVRGVGLSLTWQDGPLGRGADRKRPNGAFVEDVLASVIARLDFYQNSRFACEENQLALEGLRSALTSLESRTSKREAAGIEGTHKVTA